MLQRRRPARPLALLGAAGRADRLLLARLCRTARGDQRGDPAALCRDPRAGRAPQLIVRAPMGPTRIVATVSSALLFFAGRLRPPVARAAHADGHDDCGGWPARARCTARRTHAVRRVRAWPIMLVVIARTASSTTPVRTPAAPIERSAPRGGEPGRRAARWPSARWRSASELIAEPLAARNVARRGAHRTAAPGPRRSRASGDADTRRPRRAAARRVDYDGARDTVRPFSLVNRARDQPIACSTTTRDCELPWADGTVAVAWTQLLAKARARSSRRPVRRLDAPALDARLGCRSCSPVSRSAASSGGRVAPRPAGRRPGARARAATPTSGEPAALPFKARARRRRRRTPSSAHCRYTTLRKARGRVTTRGQTHSTRALRPPASARRPPAGPIAPGVSAHAEAAHRTPQPPCGRPRCAAPGWARARQLSISVS